MTDRAALATDFLSRSGWGTATRRPLAGDASARRYDRLTLGTHRAVLMDAPPDRGEDVTRFTRMARWLRDMGFSAPEILAEDPRQGFLIVEDLGDDLLARLVAADPTREGRLYAATVDFLIALCRCPPPDFLKPLDGPALADLTRLTAEWYPRGLGLPALDPEPISAEIETLYAALNRESPVASLRDFHAENLIWLPDRSGPARLGLLDFQDATAAHPVYDLVSLLQDARREVSAATEAREGARFAAALGIEPDRFSALYALIGAQRALRILGIFARLCLQGGKAQYVDLIPRTWATLQRNLVHPALAGLARAAGALPAPTPDRLERIKAQCGRFPNP